MMSRRASGFPTSFRKRPLPSPLQPLRLRKERLGVLIRAWSGRWGGKRPATYPDAKQSHLLSAIAFRQEPQTLYRW